MKWAKLRLTITNILFLYIFSWTRDCHKQIIFNTRPNYLFDNPVTFSETGVKDRFKSDSFFVNTTFYQAENWDWRRKKYQFSWTKFFADFHEKNMFSTNTKTQIFFLLIYFGISIYLNLPQASLKRYP